jgi:phenylacetate-CoA ligase
MSPRGRLEAAQLERLRALIEAIRPANAFYAYRLPSGVEDLEDFRARVPFTRKTELISDQAANPPFGSNLTYPLASYCHFSQTSATTGTPLRWLDTPESWGWMLDNWTRVFETAGITASDRIFFAFSFGPFLGFWTAFDAAKRMGCLAMPGGGMRTVARLHMIRDTGATVLCCTPTYAIHLGRVAASEAVSVAPSKVRLVVVAGEPGGSIPSARSEIENLWPGARVIDHHGMTEIGPVSYNCPVQPDVLHVIESAFIAEIVDGLGAPVPAGTVGELVLTNLGRIGSPLIRYRTGDLVRAATAQPCACGSHELTLEGGVLGRTDDMVVVRGVNVFPSAVEEVVRACGGVSEYQVRVSTARALTELSIVVEPDSPNQDTGRLCHRLEDALRDATSLRIPVTAAEPGSLPRFEMKARRWVRE